MNDESRYLNNVSPEMGWVSVADINGLMTIMMRDLEVVVMPPGAPISRMHVIEHFDSIRHQLQKRAVDNYQQLFPRLDPATGVRLQARGAAVKLDEPSAKADYEKHRADIALRRY